MIMLKKNGVVHEVGGHEVMRTFEEAIRTWNDEFSGWDANGDWWHVCELPDVPEYRDSRDAGDRP